MGPRDSVQEGVARAGLSYQHRQAPGLRLLIDFLDWFIPDALAKSPRHTRFRARLTVAIGFLCGIAVLATLAAASRTPDSIAVRLASFFLVAVLVTTPFLLKLGLPDR